MPGIDNYGLWKRHEAEQETQLKRLPKCDYCGEPIQEEFLYEINGETLCEDCMKKQYRKPNNAI